MLKYLHILIIFLIVSCFPEQVNYTIYNQTTDEEKIAVEESFKWFNKIVNCPAVSIKYENKNSTYFLNNFIPELAFTNIYLSCPQKPHMSSACIVGLDRDIIVLRYPWVIDDRKKCDLVYNKKLGINVYECDDRIPIIWHELGHEFGLEHTSNDEDVMSEDGTPHDIKLDALDRFKDQLFKKTNICKWLR